MKDSLIEVSHEISRRMWHQLGGISLISISGSEPNDGKLGLKMSFTPSGCKFCFLNQGNYRGEIDALVNEYRRDAAAT